VALTEQHDLQQLHLLDMKHCPKCNQEKPFEAFYASSTHKSGYASWCKECEAQRSKDKFQRRKEQHLAKAKEWRQANPEVNKAAIQAWREINQERMASTYRDWASRNTDKVNAKWMKREASKKHRTPVWLTDDELWMIEQVYDIAAKRTKMLGIDFHVDHIVPLQGKTVSGLHVPWNLQVLPAKQNRQKSNHF
jgi:hypothetical protein